MLEENLDDESCEAEYSHCTEIGERINIARIQAKLKIESIGETSGVKSSSSDTVHNVRLPKLHLEKYDLQPSNWLCFWTQFQGIHSSNNLPDEVKLQYLRMCLLGSAKQLVDSYPTVADNYDKAIDHLKSRYGRTDLIIRSTYKELMDIIRSKPSISTLYDLINCKIKGLETLGVNNDQSEILCSLIEECLPIESLKIWERRELNVNENRLSALLTFLRKEVETFERFKDIESSNRSLSTAASLVSAPSTSGGTSRTLKCSFCKGNHLNKSCKAQLSISERRDIVRSDKLCFACLSPGHSVSNCKVRLTCSLCKGRHYSLVCVSSSKPTAREECRPSVKNTSDSVVLFSGQSPNETVVLQTLLGKINGKVVRILVDSGSHRSYISSRVCVGIERSGVERFSHMLFGGSISNTVSHDVFDVDLLSLDSKAKISFKALRQDTICGPIPNESSLIKQLAVAGIHLSDDGQNRPIDVLLGADVIGNLIISVKKVDSLLAMETPLGWCLIGTTVSSNPSPSVSLLNVISSLFNYPLPNLWDLEVIGIESPTVKEDKCYENILQFKKNINVHNGRYEVALPWILGHPAIPTGREMAELRLQQVVKRLSINNLFDDYDAVFRDWEATGIIELVRDDVLRGHYLPHRPIVREEKTTRVRPVFDASAKSFGSVSLNECLEPGPNLLSDLVDLLLRFRFGRIGVVADIKQAFLMIGLRYDTDKDMLKFLWVQDGELITYRHNRVVFGLASSPFLLNATIKHHLDSFQGKVANTLKGSFYVDDCVVSLDTLSEAYEFKTASCEILAQGKFELRGWIMSGDPIVKSVLGLRWDAKNDLIGCFKPKLLEKPELTKRCLLSIIGRLFDPLGFLAAPLLYLKCILQKCFKAKLEWNDPLPSELSKLVNNWIENIHLIESIAIPRCIKGAITKGLQLHVFCDASSVGLGVCIFMRSESEEGVNLSLVCCKARVCPMQATTIPRLELIGATLACRLGSIAKVSLAIDNITFWSDSMIVLYWIKKGVWKSFVGNRVKEIRSNSKSEEWRFINGKFNPADLISRGCTLKDYFLSEWWKGPPWLREPPSEWPDTPIIATQEALQERAELCLFNVASFQHSNLFRYFSSFKRNVRLMGWICRFLNKARGLNKEKGELTAEELQSAETKLFKWIQSVYLFSEDKYQPSGLKILIDKDGVGRICSKILSDQFSSSFRQPILLPPCTLVEYLMRDRHLEMYHVGVCWLLNDLRKKFWILKGRRMARKIINSCVSCQRHRRKPIITPPVGLPNSRVNLGKVFSTSGCDLFGPLFLKNGSKVWVVLFTCAVYRAVHLEIVTSLSTDAFLLSLRRMIGRRGRISTLISDNATNFVGAFNNIRKEAVEELKIKWIFNVPTGSWWGGFFERLIGIIKMRLKCSLGLAHLTYQELETVLVEIEAVLNGRPITYLSDDLEEPAPISPSLFLQQEEVTSEVPDLDAIDRKSLNARVRYLCSIRDDLKKRFQFEYLGALAIYNSKVSSSNSVVVGMVVWIGNDSKKRLFWELGRVLEVIEGKDGVGRVARLKTQNGVILRPVQRLYPLEGIGAADLLESSNSSIDEQISSKPNVSENSFPALGGVDAGGSGEDETVRVSSFGRNVRRPKRLNL